MLSWFRKNRERRDDDIDRELGSDRNGRQSRCALVQRFKKL